MGVACCEPRRPHLAESDSGDFNLVGGVVNRKQLVVTPGNHAHESTSYEFGHELQQQQQQQHGLEYIDSRQRERVSVTCEMMDRLTHPQYVVVAIVYFALLLDNILLTVVVPIIPDYLYTTDLLRLLVGGTLQHNSTALLVVTPTPPQPSPDSENGRVALLLSSKALVQLVTNPAVGAIVAQIGCRIPLLVGSCCLFLTAAIFAVAEHYVWLCAARSLHGVASAFIGVAGMSAIAERFPEERDRSRSMGAVLGSVALGVLLGYPLGGLLYQCAGKEAPFVLLAALAAIGTVLQCVHLKVTPTDLVSPAEEGGVTALLSDRHVLVTAGAIFVSTTGMAVLEPCLPLWLMQTVHPQKWQLGTVFIPDSVGYLIGTNCFGALAYQLGRGRVALAAMMLVGLSAFLVPCASSMLQLAAPHLGMGLGIGVVDAALVPLLARLADSNTNPAVRYGSLYALQQAAVSLAYAIGPLLGGVAVRTVGFPWLMRFVGLANILYCPLLAWLALITPPSSKDPDESKVTILLTSAPTARYNSTTCQPTPKYQRFQDSDSD